MKESREQADFSLEVRMEQLGRLTCPEGWTGEIHSHAFWELIYVAQGKGYMQYDGLRMDAPQGGVYLIRPYEKHTFCCLEDQAARIVYLGFRYSRNYRVWESRAAYHDVCSYLPQMDELRTFLHELSDKNNKVSLETQALDALRALMPLVAWLDGQTGAEATRSHSGLLCRKVIKYLRENLDKNVTVQEIAASLYLSPHYLGNVFHQQMKLTIKQYQMRLKMEAAISMMRDSDLSISDIASRLGFVTPQYFSKSFKDYFGFTPMEAKKR